MRPRDEFYNSRRLLLLIGIVHLAGLIAFGRLAYMQIFQHKKYLRLLVRQHERDKSIQPTRGTIYDSRMDELASNIEISAVVADPVQIRDGRAAAAKLAALLKVDGEEIAGKLADRANRKPLIVKRGIHPDLEQTLQDLRLEGIHVVYESMRVYPNQELTSQVLGLVNGDREGIAGLEKEYDRDLKGVPGKTTFYVDTLGSPVRRKHLDRPVQGRSLVLSIDRTLQYIAVRGLAAGVAKSRAASGVAIVMDSGTGRILALANYPGLTRNERGRHIPQQWRNRAIQDLIEPGSTLKIVLAAAALDAGVCRPDEWIDVQGGSMRVGGHVLHDTHPYAALTFKQILEYSSNIGAAKLGLRLGRERFHAALVRFGFGSQTGIDLPYERSGMLMRSSEWSTLSTATISFGQGIGVTAMQMLVAVNAVANGGYKTQPSVVDRIIDANGNSVRPPKPEPVRIMSPATAAVVTEALEGVVLRGTGKRAALGGYRAAGKTGTAQKAERGRFSASRFVASFIGFAPLPNPKVTILVQLDEPRGAIYGGEVAAPLFKAIAEETLVQLGIPGSPAALPPPSQLSRSSP